MPLNASNHVTLVSGGSPSTANAPNTSAAGGTDKTNCRFFPKDHRMSNCPR